MSEKLVIHIAAPVRRDGRTTLERIPEDRENHNFGVEYRLQIIKAGDKKAECYCWDTGYAGCGSSEEMPTPEAHIYAPNGFNRGNLAFVTAVDKMMGVSRRESSSIDSFLKNLENVEVDEAIEEMQGFTFVGFIK